MGYFDGWFKTSAQREAESKQYYVWAYPHGDAQKDKIDVLAKEFIKEKDPKFCIYYFLTAKQVICQYHIDLKEPISDEEFKVAAKQFKKEYFLKNKENLYKYFALVEADLTINQDLNYPSIDYLENRANELKAIITK